MDRKFLRDAAAAFLAGLLMGLAFFARGEDNNLGASFLGMCSKHWPCSQSLKVFDGLPVKRVGWLAVTFGAKCECSRKFLELPGRKQVRVHLANGTCYPERGRKCEKGEPFAGETIASADRKLRRGNAGLLRKYRRAMDSTKRVLRAADAQTEVLLSLCLECPLSDRARTVLLKAARKAFPGGSFVDSVLTQHCIKGLVCERHGARPYFPKGQACIADTDGDDFKDIDVEAFRRRSAACLTSQLWSYRFNLLNVSHDGYVPPLERTTKPTRDDFEALRYWLLD